MSALEALVLAGKGLNAFSVLFNIRPESMFIVYPTLWFILPLQVTAEHQAAACAYMQFENLPLQPGSSHVV
jgi:hypothetical protein